MIIHRLILFSFLLFYGSPILLAGECRHQSTHSSAQVLEVSKLGTLVLSDNRAVRLAGVVLPHIPTGLQKPEEWPAHKNSLNTLKSLLVGKNVRIHLSDHRRDRYGIWRGQVYLVNGDKKIWVQKHLTTLGILRVAAHDRLYECLGVLLRAERQARSKKLGIWSNAAYQVRKSSNVWGLMRLVDTFQLVEGKVRQVAEVRGRVYLNFGRDWRKDFTVKISGYQLRKFQQRGISVKGFKGKRVRVRGWIRLRNGPLIEIFHPDLIELVDGQKNTEANISTDW